MQYDGKEEAWKNPPINMDLHHESTMNPTLFILSMNEPYNIYKITLRGACYLQLISC